MVGTRGLQGHTRCQNMYTLLYVVEANYDGLLDSPIAAIKGSSENVQSLNINAGSSDGRTRCHRRIHSTTMLPVDITRRRQTDRPMDALTD